MPLPAGDRDVEVGSNGCQGASRIVEPTPHIRVRGARVYRGSMTSPLRTLVIFGAGGDLTARLLLPGIGQFLASERGEKIQLIGVGVDPLDETTWRSRVAASFKAGGAEGARVAGVVETTTYLQADVTEADDLRRILAQCSGIPALYFALPPAVAIASCAALAKIELPTGTVLALEKPFGTDLRSAKALNRRLVGLVPEEQIHRIDHFLGKSTVLNLLGLRFANRVFEPIWNAEHIEKIEIAFDEHLGLEGRAGYYDHAGALVDMIQSHLLLVLALVTMEAPISVRASELRGAMAQVLRSTRVRDAVSSSRRARYTGGTIDGRKFVSYVKEPGVDPAQKTETLAEVVVSIDNWRWAGVPITLRAGKALAGERKEILVTFKSVPYLPDGFTGVNPAQQMRIAFSPESVELDISINGEHDPFTLEQAALTTTFAPGQLGPYGEVLAGILSDDPTLSVRGDEVEECWRIVAPVLAAWKEDQVPLDEYRAGSTGPAAWRS